MGSDSAQHVNHDQRKQEVVLAQVRLLCANSHVGACVTVIATAILGQLEWKFVPHSVIVGWWLYMALAAGYRYAVVLRLRVTSVAAAQSPRWAALFAIGAGLTGLGWGAAGILLYPDGSLTNQVFLVFVVGGMMLGAASVLAPRPESFLAFLIPAGFGPSIRLLLQPDQTHVFIASSRSHARNRPVKARTRRSLRSLPRRQSRIFLCFIAVVWAAASALGGSTPPPEAFSVLPLAPSGPQITPYLQYQTELAWREDAERMRVWSGIRTEQDLLRRAEGSTSKTSDHARRAAYDKNSAAPARHRAHCDGWLSH